MTELVVLIDSRRGVLESDSQVMELLDRAAATYTRLVAGGVEGMSRAPYVVPKPEEALRDPLTGLYNRRHFSRVLDQLFAEAQRSK